MRSASGRVESVVNTIETGYTNIERSLRSEIGFCVGMQLPMEMPSVLNRNVSLIEIVPSICLFIHVGDVTPTHALARSASARATHSRFAEPTGKPIGGRRWRTLQSCLLRVRPQPYAALGAFCMAPLGDEAALQGGPHLQEVHKVQRWAFCWPADPFFLCHPCAASPWSALAIGAAFR